MGCIVLAFFKIDDGIFYGGKSEVDGDGVKSVKGWELLGIQIFGCLMIALWSGVLCGIFFKVSMMLGVMRMSEEAEILGGDLYYFAPMEFDGNPADYDLADICGKIILESAKKLKESDVRGKEEEMEGGAAIESSSKFNIELVELGKMN